MNAELLVYAALGALLLYVNIRTTRYILRNEQLPSYKVVMTAAVWIVPFFGALLARLMSHGPQPVDEYADLPPGIIDEPAPQELRFGAAPVFALAEHMHVGENLPLLDWPAVDGWVEQLSSPALRDAALDLARRGWLLHLRDALGEHHHLYESEYAYVLSSLEPGVVRATAEYIATTRKRINRVLDGVARFKPEEKSILLVVDDEEVYYDYVASYYDEDGEFAFSGGMFINDGCPHFVVRRADLTQIEPVIAHELTHSAVHHLKLPLWVDEGLAVNTEHRLAGNRGQLYSPKEMHQKHQAFWGEEEIQQFWTGESFFRADDGNMLSYDLARIMVQQMGRDWPKFKTFVNSARRDDAGLAAARTALGMDLPAYVCAVLGREPDPRWAPEGAA